MHWIPAVRRSFALALLAGAAGCSDSGPVDTLPRVPVSGTVSLDGAPLPQGTVQFEPAPGTQGVSAVAEVAEGKFAIQKEQGPVPGKYRVRISSRASGKIKAGDIPGGMPKPAPEQIPAQYNSKSSLEKEVKEGANSFEFALSKKG